MNAPLIEVVLSGIILIGGSLGLYSHERHIQKLYDRIEELESDE